MKPEPRCHPSRRALLRLSLGALALRFSAPAWAAADSAPLRVITLFQGATDCAVMLGVTPCSVVDSWSEKPTYRYLRAALGAVPHVGLETQPSLEDIALLKPDVIIASRYRHERIAPLLKQIAPLLMLEEVFEFKKTLALMGAALHQQQRADEILNRWQQRVAQLCEQLQQTFAGRWPPTVSILDIREDHIRSYLPASFPGSVLTELGFNWSDSSREASGVSIKLTSKESLAVVNADIFFVFLRGQNAAVQRNYESLVQHPLWKQMRAPQQGQVWQVDGVAWSLSGGMLGANLMLDDVARVAAAQVSS